jgi:peptidoglycan/LPS O-acetylase OafA/YrhL
MKKVISALVVSILVLGATLMWFMKAGYEVPAFEIGQFGIIALLVAFGLYIAFSRLKSVKRGEPLEDELSKKILQKASSLSYYISLYIWVAMIFVNDRVKIDTEVLIGTGILAMAVVWVSLVLFFKIRGLSNE